MAKLDANEEKHLTLRKPITPAAQRALDEAAERRRAAQPAPAAKEVGGRDGPDPVRYGDWEVKGIVSDF
jgi:hypothetical protein